MLLQEGLSASYLNKVYETAGRQLAPNQTGEISLALSAPEKVNADPHDEPYSAIQVALEDIGGLTMTKLAVDFGYTVLDKGQKQPAMAVSRLDKRPLQVEMGGRSLFHEALQVGTLAVSGSVKHGYSWDVAVGGTKFKPELLKPDDKLVSEEVLDSFLGIVQLSIFENPPHRPPHLERPTKGPILPVQALRPIGRELILTS